MTKTRKEKFKNSLNKNISNLLICLITIKNRNGDEIAQVGVSCIKAKNEFFG